MEIYKIADGDFSTLTGMNGGMLESPDASKIIYARKRDLTKPETEIWVCGRDLTDHRHVYTVSCMNHNGPSATFLDDSTAVFRSGENGLSCFIMLDINTGEVKHKIFAKESHREENGIYPFSVSPEFLDANPEYPEIKECGIYLMDRRTGKIRLAVTEEQIADMVRSKGFTANENTGRVSHVQLNPSATSVMMRIGVPECPVFGALGCIDLDTGKGHLIPDKPVHQLWYDDETYMATRQFNRGKHIEMHSSYIARFSKDGEELEVLGGIGNHIDGSADRTMFTGDRCYPGYSPDIYVYEKGSKQPVTVVGIPDLSDVIWNLKVHPNPSFSRDGKRIYFNRPVSAVKTEASFIEL